MNLEVVAIEPQCFQGRFRAKGCCRVLNVFDRVVEGSGKVSYDQDDT